MTGPQLLVPGMSSAHHIDDTGRFQYGAQIQFKNPGVWPGTHAYGKVQHAPRLGDVIGVQSLTANVQMTAVVRNRATDGTSDRGVFPPGCSPSVHTRIPAAVQYRSYPGKSVSGDCRTLCDGIPLSNACLLQG
jgi:hypothetical protein